ncbi:MAG TPA: DUF1214 domain-containing protein [Acidimicrobiales bacterium]
MTETGGPGADRDADAATPAGGAVEVPPALVAAYVWGFPLVTMHRTCAAHGGVGRGMDARDRLATPADRTVVAPNNDTLYASGWFDLRAGDVEIVADPGILGDRYWSVMLLDAYTHVRYLTRRSPEPATRVGVDSFPTATLWVLARVLVDGPDDVAAARAALDGIAVTQAGSGDGSPPAEPSTERPALSPAGRGARAFFADLRAALAVDPPGEGHPPVPPGVVEALDRLDATDDAVLAAAATAARDRIAATRGFDRTGNGWGTRSRGADFGDDVAYRAAFAQVSLAGHHPAENRSYSRGFDGAAGNATLRFVPGGEPPVDGFWSLCVYGPDLFLVDNELDRYSVGDRTPGLVRDADGGLTLVVGPTRPAEPANWLPTPAGPCVLVLRAYEGRPEVVDARWFPPPLLPVGGAS